MKIKMAFLMVGLMIGFTFYALEATAKECAGSELTGSDFGSQYWQSQNRPLQQEDARRMVSSYIQILKDPSLRLGEIKDEGTAFRVIVVKEDDSVANEILVEKDTARMHADC